jgi:hypothetical protein
MRTFQLVFLVLAAACTEPSRSARDGSVVVPDCATEPDAEACDPASGDSMMFSWANSVCGFLLGCCTKGDRTSTAALMVGGDQNLGFLLLREPALLEDRRACQRGVALTLFTRFAASYQSRDDGRQRFDRDAARECLAWYQRGAELCAPGLVLADESHQPAACKRLFVAQVPDQQPCTDDGDCVPPPDGGRAVCQSRSELRADGGLFYSLGGTCAPLPQFGQSCPLPDGDCGDEGFCAADKLCRARAHLDDVCLAAPCDSQTFCDVALALPVCALRRTNFGPCSSNAQCRTDARCHPELLVCLEVPDVNPVDVEFDFCLGSGGVALARELLLPDGGLP